MKKSSSIYSVLTLLLCLLYACSYEDKTTYAGDPLPDIVIDTTNIPANLLNYTRRYADCQTKSFQSGRIQRPARIRMAYHLKTGQRLHYV